MELDVGWHRWKELLHKGVQAAEFMGLSQDQIGRLACGIGTFMANNIEPGNREQRLLNEFWTVADEDERRMLTGLLLRLVDKLDDQDGRIR